MASPQQAPGLEAPLGSPAARVPLAAYSDRLSVRPGEVINFHASSHMSCEVDSVEVVKVVCADANPDGPGVILETAYPGCEAIAGALELVRQPEASPIPRGSYGVVPGLEGYFAHDVTVLACRFYPTALEGANWQAIASLHNGGDPLQTMTLGVTSQRQLQVRNGAGHVLLVTCTQRQELQERQWYQVDLCLTIGVGLEVRCQRVGRGSSTVAATAKSDASAAQALEGRWECLLMAAERQATSDCLEHHSHFNGKLEGFELWNRSVDHPASADPAAGQVGKWDYSLAMTTQSIVDVGGNRLAGHLVNTPTRCVTGSLWTGEEMCCKHRPLEYAAIAFHQDDVDDCKWPVCVKLRVPEGTPSAVYALYLRAGQSAVENVPFHVVPPKGIATAPLAVLVSTYTYTVYGNHARPEFLRDPEWKAAWKAQAKDWGCYEHNPGDYPCYGWSTYNNHVDGTGISVASWHRPMFNLRVGYLTYPFPSQRASGLRHFPADSHLIAWLEAQGRPYDIITDVELHSEGLELLRRYSVITTGTHPEYHTREMIDALEQYRDTGGRFMYMGGNGFYWKIALDSHREGVIEIRRAEGGIRAWAAEAGEYYNQFDEEYGGMWRRNGRPPQLLSGVGFTAQGNFSGSYYRRTAESNDTRVSWILEGVGEVFGKSGLSGHGAAGFELDRADKRLGTPLHAVVLASSENHPPDVPWVLVPEEMLTHITTVSGAPPKELIRADMIFFETARGGAVFSVGSITFLGCLPVDDFRGDVSRIVANVLDRFLEPEPFEAPPC